MIAPKALSGEFGLENPLLFSRSALKNGGVFGVLNNWWLGSGGGAPSAEGAPRALAGVRGQSPREIFGISGPYNCKLFVVGSNLGRIIARRRRKISTFGALARVF